MTNKKINNIKHHEQENFCSKKAFTPPQSTDYQYITPFHKQYKFLHLLLFLLLVISFYPLLKVGFVTGDDFGNFTDSDIFHYAKNSRYYAELTGRFHYLLVFWIYYIPYLIDNQIYFYATLLLPLCIAFFLFIHFVKKYAKDKNIAYLAAIFYLTTFQIFGGHTPPAAYPLFFTLSVIFLYGGLSLLLRYYENKKIVSLLSSALLLFISTLFYEANLLNYLPILLIVLIKNFENKEKNNKRWQKIFFELLPYILLGLLYLIIYIYYYLKHPSSYNGNSPISDFSVSIFSRKLLGLGYFAFPLASYFYSCFHLCENLELIRPCYHPILAVFLHGGVIAYLKSFIAVFLFYAIIKNITIKLSSKKLIIILLSAFIIPFLFAIPLVISAKYYNSAPAAYPIAFLSFYFVILFLLSLYLLLNQSIKNVKWNKYFQILVGILLFIVTLFTQYANEKITDDIQLGNARFELMDKTLTSEVLHDGDVVYFGALHNSVSYYTRPVTHQQDCFAGYIFKKTGIKVSSFTDYNTLYQNYAGKDIQVKILNYAQAHKTGESYLSVAYCNAKTLTSNIEELVVDTLLVSYLSVNKMFAVSLLSDSDSIVPLINGNKMPHNIKKMSFANLAYFGEQRICTFQLTGSALYPATLSISNQHFNTREYQVMSKFPFLFEKGYALQYAKHINSDMDYKKMIKEKAEIRGLTYYKMLMGDALWLVYYDK